MADDASSLAPQFDDLEQQQSADELGMWIFLSTELMLFGGLFLGYTVYHLRFPAGFAAASARTDLLIGTINTAVLLTSSLCMALGLLAAKAGTRRLSALWLVLTALLGAVFVGLKGLEYGKDFLAHLVPGPGFAITGPEAAGAQMFYVLYYIMTGLHALHLTIGIVLVTVLAVMAWRGRFSAERHVPVVLGGLYWHFVDVVWVFLYPLLYLQGRH
ncbi:Quinol oxidase subunit 3 [compost metagenome]